MKIKIKPKIAATQHVALLLSEYKPEQGKQAKSYRVTMEVSSSDSIALDQIDLEPGRYLARVEVDGISSDLQCDANGFCGPLIDLGAPVVKQYVYSDHIELVLRTQEGDQATIQSLVTVKDNMKAKVPKARVYVKWALPDGSLGERNSETDENGIAASTVTGPNGTFKIEVIDIQYDGEHPYNKNLGITTKSIETAVSTKYVYSDQIELILQQLTADQATIQARITVKDEQKAIVPKARVYIKWTYPNGDISGKNTETNDKGIAAFTLSGEPGTYGMEVLDIKLDSEHPFNRVVGAIIKSIVAG